MDGDIAFAQVGSSRVAYALHGSGDLDIVYAPGIPSHLDVTMEQPRYRHYIDGLMQFGRVIRFDRRGTGISDPVPPDAVPGWELWADDLEGVLRAADSKRAVVIAANDAGPAAMLFAATHRDLVAALVLFNTTARFIADDDYPGHPPDAVEFVASMLQSVWGTEESIPLLAPSLVADAAFCRWYARFQRAACSPGAMADSMRRIFQFDARSVLPEIRCPTLVLHRENWPTVPLVQGEALAARIPGAELAVMPGGDAAIWAEAVQESIDRIGVFLGRAPMAPPDNRVFRTVLFTDIVSSTELAVQMGDARWRRLIDDYDTLAYETVRDHDGRRIKATGDGTLATFDRPTRALRAGIDIVERVRSLGIEVRAGAHTGPVAVREDGDISGVTVNATARVLRVAQPNEVLSTGLLAGLVQDDDFEFTARGEHQFKGFDEAWPLFSVALAPT